MEKNLPQYQIHYVSSFYLSTPPDRYQSQKLVLRQVYTVTDLTSSWTLLHYYFESLQVWRSLYKGMPPTQPAVLLKSCPGKQHHICCHSIDVWGRLTKTEPALVHILHHPSAHTWSLCSSLSWNLLYMLLQKETSKKKQIKMNLWDAAVTCSTHSQTAGAAPAVLLWELWSCSGKAAGQCHTWASHKWNFSHLAPIPVTWCLFLFVCLFSPSNHPL